VGVPVWRSHVDLLASKRVVAWRRRVDLLASKRVVAWRCRVGGLSGCSAGGFGEGFGAMWRLRWRLQRLVGFEVNASSEGSGGFEGLGVVPVEALLSPLPWKLLLSAASKGSVASQGFLWEDSVALQGFLWEDSVVLQGFLWEDCSLWLRWRLRRRECFKAS
jgi:hypothetical protein